MRRQLLATAAVLALGAPPARADGVDVLTLPINQGCFGIASYGIATFGTGAGSVTVNPPGPILGVYIHWVGVEDDTPPGVGTSIVTINGAPVVGQLSTPPADFAPIPRWFSWYANIGPAAGPFAGLDLVDDANKTIDFADWDTSLAFKATNGAAVTVIYDTGACATPTTIEIHTGVDYYHHRTERFSELFEFSFPPDPADRVVTFHVAHAGTDAAQTSCRGGAVWMLAGTGPLPTADLLDVAVNDRGFGINGGIEIVNDPFTNATMPCVPRVNPAPDQPYEAGHPCPNGGIATCPYRALALRPIDGGDVGAEFAVVEIDVLVPANSEWVVFQLESEADQDGESGSWAGSAFVLSALGVCGDGILDIGEECDDGNTTSGDGCSATCTVECNPNLAPAIVCASCVRCTDAARCDAQVSCPEIATVVDPEGAALTVTCDPVGTFGLGTTNVLVRADDGTHTVEATCPVTVRDCEPPVCVPPPPLALECNGFCGVAGDDPAIPAWLALATATDNCPAVTVTHLAPSLAASDCAPGAVTPVLFVASDAAGLERSCTSDITVADTTEPVLVDCMLTPAAPRGPTSPSSPSSPGSFSSMAAPRAPATPRAPASPSSPASACAGPYSQIVKIDCGVASDACDKKPDVSAKLVVTRHDIDPSTMTCVLVTEDVPVDCGELIELVRLAAPCPASGPSSAPLPTVDTGPDGIRIVRGESIRLEVTATDDCGLASATCTVDATAPTGPLSCEPRDPCDVPVCTAPLWTRATSRRVVRSP